MMRSPAAMAARIDASLNDLAGFSRVGDFERLEICLLKWRLLKIKAIRIR